VDEEFLDKDDEIIEVGSLEGKLLKIQGIERTSCQEVSDCGQKGDKTFSLWICRRLHSTLC